MHAFLLLGSKNHNSENIKKLVQKLKTKPYEFPLNKISDTRDLKKITKLAFNTPTSIIIENIDKATEEAANAFLKNLEEPQENISYILTAQNIRNVIPTIISRCEIIKTTKFDTNKTDLIQTDKDFNDFQKLPAGEKLKIIDRIKAKQDAIDFVEKLIDIYRFNLLNQDLNKEKTAMDLEILIKTLNNLKLNGNVSLQLANMAVMLN